MSINENDPNYDVDESGSVVSGNGRRQLTTGQKVGISIFVLVVFIVFTVISFLSGGRKAERQSLTAASLNSTDFHAAPISMPPAEQPAPPARMHARDAARHEMSAAESPIFTYGGSGAEASPASESITNGIRPPEHHAEAPAQAAESPLATKLKPTVLQMTKASLLPHPDMLITQGTIIPCILQTAIDSELAGFVKCVLPNDVRSTTGDVVLLDRGTVVTGEIQQGLAQGQDRVFVLWDRAETPDHAVITLASPGTDELGRSGLPGAVDNHWWQRFGGAVMLSLVQGTLQAGTALAGSSNGGGGTYVNSFQSNGQQVSDTALQNTINIPPTLKKNQGDTIAIFVAHDLDFSDVYKLTLTGARDE